MKHLGPGPHPSGSPQSVHGTPGGEEAWQREHHRDDQGRDTLNPRKYRPRGANELHQEWKLETDYVENHLVIMELSGGEANAQEIEQRMAEWYPKAPRVQTFVNTARYLDEDYFTELQEFDFGEREGEEYVTLKAEPQSDDGPVGEPLVVDFFDEGRAEIKLDADEPYEELFTRRFEQRFERIGGKRVQVTQTTKDYRGMLWAKRGYDYGDQSSKREHTSKLEKAWSKFPGTPVPKFEHPWELAKIKGPDRSPIGEQILQESPWNASKLLDRDSEGYKVGKAYYKARTPGKIFNGPWYRQDLGRRVGPDEEE